MTEVRTESPLVLDPWPPEKYIELAEQFDREAEAARAEAQHMLDYADRLSAASAQLHQAVLRIAKTSAKTSRPRRRTSNGYARVDVTQIRDFAQTYGDWFQMSQLQATVPGSRQQLLKYIKELITHGTLEAEGYKRRRRYRFVKPEASPGPFVAPRGEPSITNIRSTTTGPPVPHTRAQHSSGKPGVDKKRAARGMKIRKRKAQGHSS